MWQLIQEVWRPALEIFILAVAIYLATRFVRGTRGWPVVIGFTILLLATTLMAALLKLEVLSWLLGNASLVLILGAVVIFQPEIRRMLGQQDPKDWPLSIEMMAKALRLDFGSSLKRALEGGRITTDEFAKQIAKIRE